MGETRSAPDPREPGTPENPGPNRLRLIDLTALIAGYGMAALLIRAFWPYSDWPSAAIAAALALEYLWLGLAMAGPLVLLLDRRPDSQRPSESSGRYTRAELSWLLIGGYWIGLSFLMVPSRLSINPVFSALPLVAALAYRLVRPPRSDVSRSALGWTHHASVGLLVTWPMAWVILILLGKTLE